MRNNDTAHWGRRTSNGLATVVVAAALVVPATGCGDTLGECEVVCTFLSDGSTSWHGPYSDYTQDECDDQADQSESPSVTTCDAEWSSY